MAVNLFTNWGFKSRNIFMSLKSFAVLQSIVVLCCDKIHNALQAILNVFTPKFYCYRNSNFEILTSLISLETIVKNLKCNFIVIELISQIKKVFSTIAYNFV